MTDAPRHLFPFGLGLLLSAALAPLVDNFGDHGRVAWLCAAAALVAVFRALTRSRSWSGLVTDGLIGLCTGLGIVDKAGGWPPILAGVGAGVLVLAAALRWMGPRITAAIVTVGFVGFFAAGGARSIGGVHTWNQYHYVLGTKYFDEVGYQDLYTATLLADADGAHHFDGVKKVRNMRNYFMLTREEAFARAEKEGLRARFTDARWAEFKHDLEVFYPMLGENTWPGVLTDLGFNPSPVWVVINQPLLRMFPLDRDLLRTAAALQLPMYALTLAAALWAFGGRTTLWLVLWNVLFFGSRGRLYGGYWSYDWFALVILATALVVKAKPALAAVPVAVAGLMRGFGGLLALGPTARWSVMALRKRLDPWSTRFLVALAVAMVLLGAWSVTTGRGLEAWPDWYEKIATHSARISTGGRHLGMKVLFGEDWSVPGHTEDLDLRREIYARQAWAYHLAQVVLLGWLAMVLPRRNRVDGALLGFIAAFATMVLSRYYYAAWSALLLLGTRERDREARLPVLLGLFGMLMLHEVEFFVKGTTPDSRHQDVNLLLLGLAIVTLTVFTLRDLRGRRMAMGPDPD